MGGIILIGLLFVGILILVTRALRGRVEPPRDAAPPTPHEAVVSRLEDHRKRRQAADDVGDG